MSCKQCDTRRIRDGKKHLVGQPCDICNDTGVSHLGDRCRHCTEKDIVIEDPAEYTAHTYAAADGRVIDVICPWGEHSGMIPPPTITFGPTDFVYEGSEPT